MKLQIIIVSLLLLHGVGDSCAKCPVEEVAKEDVPHFKYLLGGNLGDDNTNSNYRGSTNQAIRESRILDNIYEHDPSPKSRLQGGSNSNNIASIYNNGPAANKAAVKLIKAAVKYNAAAVKSSEADEAHKANKAHEADEALLASPYSSSFVEAALAGADMKAVHQRENAARNTAFKAASAAHAALDAADHDLAIAEIEYNAAHDAAEAAGADPAVLDAAFKAALADHAVVEAAFNSAYDDSITAFNFAFDNGAGEDVSAVIAAAAFVATFVEKINSP